MTSWTRLDDGTWGVKIEGSDFHEGQGSGLPRTVTSRDGKKKALVLGEFVRRYLAKGGRVVDIYRVATPEQEAQYTEEYRAEMERIAAS